MKPSLLKQTKENSIIIFKEKECGEKVKHSIHENGLVRVVANVTAKCRQLAEGTSIFIAINSGNS
jgi:hypothetical protein